MRPCITAQPVAARGWQQPASALRRGFTARLLIDGAVAGLMCEESAVNIGTLSILSEPAGQERSGSGEA